MTLRKDGYVNVSLPSITALQAGLTLADMLPQPEVFVNIGTSYPKSDFHTMLTSKKQFHHYF